MLDGEGEGGDSTQDCSLLVIRSKFLVAFEIPNKGSRAWLYNEYLYLTTF